MKEKTNQKFKKGIITGVAVLSIASLGILGGQTYAKYFTKIDGEGSATIARWSFKANNETKTIADTMLPRAQPINEPKTAQKEIIKAHKEM